MMRKRASKTFKTNDLNIGFQTLFIDHQNYFLALHELFLQGRKGVQIVLQLLAITGLFQVRLFELHKTFVLYSYTNMEVIVNDMIKLSGTCSLSRYSLTDSINQN